MQAAPLCSRPDAWEVVRCRGHGSGARPRLQAAGCGPVRTCTFVPWLLGHRWGPLWPEPVGPSADHFVCTEEQLGGGCSQTTWGHIPAPWQTRYAKGMSPAV